MVYTAYGTNGTGTVIYHPAVTEPAENAAAAYWEVVNIKDLPKAVYNETTGQWHEVTYYVVETPIDNVDITYYTTDATSASVDAAGVAVGADDEDRTITILNTDANTTLTVEKTWSGN